MEAGPWDAESQALIARLALILLGVYVLRGVLQFVRSYMAHVAGWGVVSDARLQIYEHLQRLSLRFYENKQTGQLMSRMVNDSDLFERLIAHAVPDVLVNALTLIGVAAVLFVMEWRLALLSLVPIPLVVLAMRSFARYVRPAFRERQKELGQLNATLNDNLSGIREIKAFTREEREALRIQSHIHSYRDSLLNALRLMATFQPFVDFASSLGTIIVIYFGGRLAFQHVLPIADLVAFFLYLEMFYNPVRALSGAWEAVQEALAGGDRVVELLKEQPEVDETRSAVALKGRARGALTFEDVTFAYNEGENVLEHIDLTVPANTVVALVGPTGVGKTTLASLIPRFYDVCEGRITLDGHDLREIRLNSLRQQISIVLQDVFLFHGTVRENILFGNPDATDEEVVRAAEVANAAEFIERLPDGYNTMIGERGVKLSGGQKQRLAIARAVLKDAPILILDEATSSVDTETELLIQQALERLMVGRTTIIIAHRLSTIRNADQIVVLEGRRIVDQGTHRELMARDGLYRHLNQVQTRFEDQWEAIRPVTVTSN
ncbi:MAG: putative multidrug export ATP-binding/permease protein [Chloroflexi bacterium ADurb.Bin325]|nr:MAG: putative multidrug export ATP-binding/permease protein [Chloroflexi bacterium ADurb.Bin325]